MKKFLPKSINNPSGFTLIELLVVISIIAILSVIGITIFTGVQKNARDAKRRGDVDAISKALEVNKTATGYQLLNDNQFANGKIPLVDSQAHPYCINTTAVKADPATWLTTCPAGWNPVANTVPAANTTSFKVCAATETTGAGGVPGVFCRSNAQ